MTPKTPPPLDVLRRFAPGTTLRDGAELIFRQGTGVLMVLGSSGQIDDLCTGGFRFADVPVTAQRIAELAKMDGGIVIDDATNTITRANVHFIPTLGFPPTKPAPASGQPIGSPRRPACRSSQLARRGEILPWYSSATNGSC